MKLILGILTLCTVSFANDGRHLALSSSAVLPSTYTVNAQGLVASELFSFKHIRFVNYTNSSIACLSVGGDSANIQINNTAPPTPPNGREGREIFLAASEHFEARDFYPSENMYCRGENGAVSSGDLFFNAW